MQRISKKRVRNNRGQLRSRKRLRGGGSWGSSFKAKFIQLKDGAKSFGKKIADKAKQTWHTIKSQKNAGNANVLAGNNKAGTAANNGTAANKAAANNAAAGNNNKGVPAVAANNGNKANNGKGKAINGKVSNINGTPGNKAVNNPAANNGKGVPAVAANKAGNASKVANNKGKPAANNGKPAATNL